MAVMRQERLKQWKEQLEHVLEEVLDEPVDSNISNALNNHKCTSVCELAASTNGEITALDFKDNNGNIVELKVFEVAELRLFREHFYHCINQGQSFATTEDHKTLEHDEFDMFHITHTMQPVETPSTPTASSSSATPSTSFQLRDFLKGTKQDMNLFPVLKDPAKWDTFEREFEAVARSQNLQKVLDHTCVPSTTDESLLFQEMQAFLHAVFVKNLKLDEGQALVRMHQKAHNAQKICSTLKQKMTASTAAEISSDDLSEHIPTSCFNDGKWKGTSHLHIIHQIEQVQLCHENSMQRFGDQALKKFLQNAFMEVPEFDATCTTEEVNFNQGGKRPDFQQCVSALAATAQCVDKRNATRASRPRRSPQNVHFHDIDEQDDVFLDAEELLNDCTGNDAANINDNFDINTTVFEVSNASSNPKACLPPQAWCGLSSAGKHSWGLLAEEDKIALIENLTGRQQKHGNLTGSQQNHSQKRRPPAPDIANATNMCGSAPNDIKRFEAAFHAFCLDNQEEQDTEVEESSDNNSGTDKLHACVAQKPPKQKGKIHDMLKKSPGNINCLLSSPQEGGNPT